MTLCNNFFFFLIITGLTSRNRISIFCACSILLFHYFVIMCSLFNANCFCLITVFASVGYASFFLTGSFFCNCTSIPVMVIFLSYFSRRNQYSAIFTIDISGITFFLTGCFFSISSFFVLMIGCF